MTDHFFDLLELKQKTTHSQSCSGAMLMVLTMESIRLSNKQRFGFTRSHIDWHDNISLRIIIYTVADGLCHT